MMTDLRFVIELYSGGWACSVTSSEGWHDSTHTFTDVGARHWMKKMRRKVRKMDAALKKAERGYS